MYKRPLRSTAKLVFALAIAAIGIAGFIGLSSFEQTAGASASGPSPSHTDAPGETNCTSCHTQFPVNSGNGGITIAGIPKKYTPGQQIPITVTVSEPDGVSYGFQFTAIDANGRRIGTYSLPSGMPPEMQLNTGFVNGIERRYLSHTIDGITPTMFGSKSWTFTWNAPMQPVGKVRFYAAGNGANSDGGPNGDQIYTTNRFTSNGAPPFDFDGDSKTDLSIFRPGPGEWWYLRSSDGGNFAAQFGTSTDTPVPADYTGDTKSDFAFWRQSTGEWFVLRSEDSTFYGFPFGANGDVPVTADYDGDGRADAAIFRPSTNLWFIQRSSDLGITITPFGLAGDKPVASDYDGDGKADVAIFRPTGGSGSGEWWYLRSIDGQNRAFVFGSSTDKAVPGDYTGDGKTDLAFWRPSTGEWFVLRSEDLSFFAFPFGAETDIPAPGDYDGDGIWDAAVFRPSNTVWYAAGSTAGVLIQQFGLAGDKPLPNSFVR